MSCPSVEQLAAAAAGAHESATLHAGDCTECAALLAQQLEVRTLGRQLDVPRLSPLRRAKLALAYDPVVEIRALAHRLETPQLDDARRARLAAETLARADAEAARTHLPWRGLAGALALAAALALVAWSTLDHAPHGVAVPWPDHAWVAAHTPALTITPIAPIVVAPDPVAVAPSPVTPTSVPAHVGPARSATVIGDTADFTRATADRDTIELRDGTLSIDARDRSPVAVAIGDTTIHVANAHVEIVAAHGVIVSAHAFAGSVERTSPESKAVISAGEVWTPPPAAASLAAFRAGWSALHANRNADALIMFERATDPVISEEATFWAAIAAQRSGDHDGATRRFHAFLDAYPGSARADAARAALR